MAFIVGKENKILGDSVPVSGHVATSTPIYTAPPAKQVVITKVVARVIGAFPPTTPCSAKIEINPAAGDLFPEEVLVNILAAEDQWIFSAEARSLVVPAGAQVDMTITIASDQTLFFAVDTIGYVVF